MKTDVLKAVWPRGIPLEEYPRAVALLETVATAKHWAIAGGERVEAPAWLMSRGAPIGAVDSGQIVVATTHGIRSARDGHLVSSGAKARPSAMKPIGVVSPTAFESLVKDVKRVMQKSAVSDYARPEDYIASPETLRLWKKHGAIKPKSHCSEALVQHVAALLRAEPCTAARLRALTGKTDRPIREALQRCGAVEAGRVFRADGSDKGTLPVAWKLPEAPGR